MRTVWKFTPDRSGRIEMPKGAKILFAGPQGQNDTVRIWAEVDTDAPTVSVGFIVVGTGHPLQESWVHVASWQDSPFIWHLYREPLGDVV